MFNTGREAKRDFSQNRTILCVLSWRFIGTTEQVTNKGDYPRQKQAVW